MKILSTIFFNYSNQSYQVTQNKKTENNQDLFIKNNNSVYFGARKKEKNPYKEVLQNPSLTQRVMDLISTAATMLVLKSSEEDIPIESKSPKKAVTAKKTVKKKSTKDQEIDLYKREIKELKEQNRLLKKLVDEKEQGVSIASEPDLIDNLVQTSVEIVEEVAEEQEVQKKTEEIELFEPSKTVLSGPKLKGFVDLDKIPDKKKSRFKKEDRITEIPQPTQSEQLKQPESDVSNSEDIKKDVISVLQPESDDKMTEILPFIIPGTVNKNVLANLKLLFSKCKKTLEQSGISGKYQIQTPVTSNVKDTAIINEIETQEGSPYKHINKKNASKVAKAINSEIRFQHMFTLHAAMRLIDRFADFESEEPLDSQCHKLVDSLTKVLQKSFKEGIPVYYYEDKKSRIGLKLRIPESAYDKDTEKIFGSYPLCIGICQRNPHSQYFGKYPLICTVYSKGI